MSSEVATLFRHQGTEFGGLLSSGMIQELFYNPGLFTGDPEVLAKLKGWLEEFPRNPSYAGMIVVDLDNKRRWDMQRVRYLDYLSPMFDYSWLHFDALKERGWISEGVYLADGTRAGAFSGGLLEFEKLSRKATKGVETFSDHMKRCIYMRLHVTGWINMSWDMEEIESPRKMLVELQTAGFSFNAEELAAWSKFKSD